MPSNNLNNNLSTLKRRFPSINFVVGQRCSWSPQDNKVTYQALRTERNLWALLHELGHAQKKHAGYTSDVELLLMEDEAWQAAKQIANDIGQTIPEDHIQDCLDTYREWLHRRSTCPNCNLRSLQTAEGLYMCHNCSQSWQVSRARFCRAYRRSVTQTQKVVTTSKQFL